MHTFCLWDSTPLNYKFLRSSALPGFDRYCWGCFFFVCVCFFPSSGCVGHSGWVGLTPICFGIFDASWWELNFELVWEVLGLRFHQKVSFFLTVRSMIPLIKGTRSQCLWTSLPLLLAHLKTVCMMSGFKTILSGSRFNEKAPALWCKHHLFGSN